MSVRGNVEMTHGGVLRAAPPVGRPPMDPPAPVRPPRWRRWLTNAAGPAVALTVGAAIAVADLAGWLPLSTHAALIGGAIGLTAVYYLAEEAG